jgi:Asp-tRNA(Asn)/Glu-tRNA(Gln) amidotransferase A subunit family amidase
MSWIAVAVALVAFVQDKPAEKPVVLPLSKEELQAAGKVANVALTDKELELMLKGVCEQLEGYALLAKRPLANDVAPAFGLARFLEHVAGTTAAKKPLDAVARALPSAERPANLEDLAYADIPTLASLIRSRKVSCVELTDMYLARLERLDKQLACVITLMPERARAQAKRLDDELGAGKWRGMLHGIPWGAKDLLATRGVRTTWGAGPYKDQVIDEDATVVKKLDDAGAVLIAKLTLGELAMDDEWFGGTTKNPWKLDQGSSGSSAGPASATAAGCVAFAIGSETCGSILSPSARCGCSSLRPTYGRVSRHGAMALAWSMDKLGPLCRSVQDAALVFSAIAGADPLDEETVERKFTDAGNASVKGLRVGYVKGAWKDQQREDEVLASLGAIGVEAVAVELPQDPADELMTILAAEAATAFDELTSSGRDELLVRQGENAWPNMFRQARLIPAVEYIRASRERRKLTLDFAKMFDSVDVLVHPTLDNHLLVALNLTGHPSVCMPAGPRADGTPRSLAFSAQLFDEARLLAVAEAWQRSTNFHTAHPKL